MDAILQRANGSVISVLEQWDTVDTVTALRFGSDRFDPSFFISYDVYYHGSVPPPEERERAFTFAAAFEATVDGQKDRFLLEDIPIRVEYKAISDVDFLIAKARLPDRGEPVASTYGFYRLVSSEIVMHRSNWLPVVKRTLADLPDAFWSRRARILRAHMEHALSDLTSAAYTVEKLFYQLSLARFLETVGGLLFAINHRFEPAGRILHQELQSLPLLPEEFESRFEHLMRHDEAVSSTRKGEIAQLVAKSLLRMS